MILQVAKGTIIIFLRERQQILIAQNLVEIGSVVLKKDILNVFLPLALLWKVHGPSFELLITFTQQCFVNTGSLVEMTQRFLKRRINVLHFVNVFLLFKFLEQGMALHLNKLEFL